MTENDHEELADELEQDADKLQQRSDELGHEAGAVREDWERKRADPSVPGAPERHGSDAAEGDPEGAPQGDDPEGAAAEEE